MTTKSAVQIVLIAVATAMTTTLYGAFFAGWGFLPRLLAVAVAASALAAVRLRPVAALIVCVTGLSAWRSSSRYQTRCPCVRDGGR